MKRKCAVCNNTAKTDKWGNRLKTCGSKDCKFRINSINSSLKVKQGKVKSTRGLCW